MKRLNLFALFLPLLFLGGGYPVVLCDPDGRLHAETADYTRRDACVTVKTVTDPILLTPPWALIY